MPPFQAKYIIHKEIGDCDPHSGKKGSQQIHLETGKWEIKPLHTL